MTVDITAPIFIDKDKAREHLESLRWPNGPVCPHCGTQEYTKLEGKKHRPGLFQCNACREQFTVTVGTVFERSKVPLNKWLLATHLMAASKKGMSAHQLHRMLGVTYKTAWFMFHRIREAMRSGSLSGNMGGGGQIVEIDETYFGTKKKIRGRKAGYAHKHAVLTLVDRSGSARSFHIDSATKRTVLPIIRKNLDKEARVITDGAGIYQNLDKEYTHAFVDHSKGQYGRGEIHTNTVEGYFSIFKRGMRGIYQHCGAQHLHRYLAEFDFRYNNRKIEDAACRDVALKGIEGRRLTYRRTDQAAHA